jgi:hypothetical protein
MNPKNNSALVVCAILYLNASVSILNWRQENKIDNSIHDVMMSGFACMYFQSSSLLQQPEQSVKFTMSNAEISSVSRFHS